MSVTAKYNPVASYIAAFSRCYPNAAITVTRKSTKEGPRYMVAINGDDGGRTLSETELNSATRDFNAGKGL